MSGLLIETREALSDALELFSSATRVGLDVEGDGLYRYRSRCCMIQLADEEREVIVDPLAIDDLSALAPLLGERGPELVVHDVSFDAKMLDTRGLRLHRVFDTSVASRFLAEPATGLSSMLDKHLGVSLDKSFQRADWGERPLSDAHREYLVADVRHLPKLADLLEERAREADILEEIDEETRYAIDRALQPEEEREPWTRVKGERDLDGVGRSLLKALADVREAAAQERDVPPFRVAHNGALIDAARRKPKRLSDLRRVRGLHKLGRDRLRAALEEALERGPLARPPRPPAPPSSVRKARKAREKALGEWRAAQAEERGVDVQVVLPGHCLRELVSLEEVSREAVEAVPGFGEKRARLYGEGLLALLVEADG